MRKRYCKSLSLLFLLSVLLTMLNTAAHAANPAVAAGGYHSIALKDDGTLCTWGLNVYGQIGDGTFGDNTNKATPVQIAGIENIIKIAGAGYVTMAIKNDGTLWMWGRNNSGQLGNDSTDDLSTPAQVNGISNIKAVAGGGNHTVALKNDGTVWTWGANKYGQLGNGKNKESLTPINISNLTNVKAVAANGNYSMALKNDGTLWTWGFNSSGQLGDGTTVNKNAPVQVSVPDHVIAIAAGGTHAMAVRNDGTLWAWGMNDKGQLGDGTNEKRTTPVQITGVDNITAIACGGSHSLVVKGDGTVWAWGDNTKGQLGNGTNENKNTPVQIPDITDVAYISAGASFSLVLKNDGTVWAWGENFSSQLGDGTAENKNKPVQTKGTEGTDFLKPGIPITHIINASSGDNGHIEPAGAVNVNEGSIRVFNMVPDAGYELEAVTADGVSVGAVNTYAFSYIYENHTIDVSFKSLPVSLPILETATVTDITSSTAVSGGEIISDGGAAITSRGVCWNDSQLPTIDNAHTNDGTGKGIFTSEITGLAPGTTYYVRAYSINKEGISYGKEFSFSSLCSLPKVTTDEIVSVSATEAAGGGTVTDDGGCPVTARGLCWNTSPSPTIDNAHTGDGTGKGSFTSSITGLTSDTTYYVRAYAANKEGTSYGDDVSFSVSCSPATVTTGEISSISETAAAGGGTVTDDGGCPVTARGLCWSVSPPPTIENAHSEDGTGKGSFTSSITGLTRDTTYYVRAYAANKEGTSYGDEILFKTMTGPVLSVTPEFQEVSKQSGTTIFSIENRGTGLMEWNVSEDTDWLSVETPVKKENNGEITVIYEVNSGDSRIGIITVSAPDAGNSPQIVEVRQATAHDGDVNNSGELDLDDVIMILKMLSGIDTGDINLSADINKDEKIGMEEAVYGLEIISGMIE